MKSLLTTSVLLCIFPFLFPHSAPSTTKTKGCDFDNPLLYRALVIRATVLDSSLEKVKTRDWGPAPDLPEDMQSTVKFVELYVGKVLKGYYTNTTISIAVPLEISMKRSQEFILCLAFNERLRGGMFIVATGADVFRSSEGMWINLHDGESVTLEGICAKTESTSIEHIAEKADLIATGTIVAVNGSRIYGDDGTSGTLVEYTLQPESVLKGHVLGDSITFTMVTSGLYCPDWRTAIPARIEIGEQWYAFLKKGDIGYYPFAGSNGLLKIVGDRLIYDLSVDFEFTKPVLDKLVTREVKR